MPADNRAAVAFLGNSPRLAETLNDIATGGRFESTCCHLPGLEEVPISRILNTPPENDYVRTVRCSGHIDARSSCGEVHPIGVIF